ncbi:MAG: glutamyl-tRNA(Gln) amidotransferase subunit [Candidatus Woesearchaeota archaeon]|nr:glutamyl-tRNA(Gln) amidotransferase subunit [Candidatus Woesearchaeota archaeon]
MTNLTRIKVVTKKGSFEGVHITDVVKGKRKFLILKLDNGYNIGIDYDNIKEKKVIKDLKQKQNRKTKKETKHKEFDSSIFILHTGGTIASRVDYETGAVKALFNPEDIIELFPEILGDYTIKSKLLSNIFSEDFTFKVYNLIIKEIESLVKSKENIRGVILTHGTDTLHYTSAALKFSLQGLPFPIVIVGSQRSSDRPSTDARLNLVSAVNFINYAYENNLKPDVFVCMHASINDDSAYIFDGFNVRKMHTSRRDAFKQINDEPLAKVLIDGSVKIINDKLKSKPKEKDEFKAQYYDESLKIGILYSHPNLLPEEILAFKEFDGLIIAGTGLGHLGINVSKEVDNSKNLEALKQLIKNKTIVAVAPQTINGRINLNVYSTGRMLKEIGVLGNLCDMTIETAFVKLAYLLSNYDTEKIKQLYEENLFGEINDRSKYLKEF